MRSTWQAFWRSIWIPGNCEAFRQIMSCFFKTHFDCPTKSTFQSASVWSVQGTVCLIWWSTINQKRLISRSKSGIKPSRVINSAFLADRHLFRLQGPAPTNIIPPIGRFSDISAAKNVTPSRLRKQLCIREEIKNNLWRGQFNVGEKCQPDTLAVNHSNSAGSGEMEKAHRIYCTYCS